MRPIAIAGTFVIAMLGLQMVADESHAISSRREQNRQFILSEEGLYYTPGATTLVTLSRDGVTHQVAMTRAQAIEAELDFLDRHNVLLTLLTTAPPTAAPADPITPVGQYLFREKGLHEKGGRCPTVEPAQNGDINALFNDTLQYNDARFGIMTTNLSKAVGSNGQPVSILWWWSPEADHVTTPAQKSWHYTNWDLKAGPFIDYICIPPSTPDRGQYRQESYVQTHVLRTAPL